MLDKQFLIGEEKWLEFEIGSRRKNDTIVIASANYTLKEADGTMTSGACVIDGTGVRALIEPTKRGASVFELTVTVPPETIKERVRVSVT